MNLSFYTDYTYCKIVGTFDNFKRSNDVYLLMFIIFKHLQISYSIFQFKKVYLQDQPLSSSNWVKLFATTSRK